ncbi:MAG: glycosyltransferase family 4 protein [Pleurocapsa sp. MO_226.B13]|nr:glycosyltransferase family 4 protein [Pleurocapsa sp. MO_226.B13]
MKQTKIHKNRKLLIIPCYPNSIGGTTISLILLVRGIFQLGLEKRVKLFVEKGSLLEDCLIKARLTDCIEVVNADSSFQSALQRVHQHPHNFPLLLDNAVTREKLPQLLRASLPFRLHKRPVYHFCHDLALSYNQFGNLARKATFACLSPKAICNSQYTASHIRSMMPDICGVLYQPVDLEKIYQRLAQNFPPPENLRPILASGAKIILTPSRINQPGIVNDKNLRALLPVLVELLRREHSYHMVIIGEDSSPGQVRKKDLLQQAKDLGVSSHLSILPPTIAIEDYYKFSDLVLSLAPREPFGRTVVEAISCGVPVIGSNTGGINEILQNFAPSWTVDPKDFFRVADKIIRLEKNPETVEKIEKGQEWVKQYCSYINYTSDIMNIVGLLPK